MARGRNAHKAVPLMMASQRAQFPLPRAASGHSFLFQRVIAY